MEPQMCLLSYQIEANDPWMIFVFKTLQTPINFFSFIRVRVLSIVSIRHRRTRIAYNRNAKPDQPVRKTNSSHSVGLAIKGI